MSTTLESLKAVVPSEDMTASKPFYYLEADVDTRGYFSDTDKEWYEQEEKRIVAETEKSVEQLLGGIADAKSNEDLFRALIAFEETRRTLRIDEIQVGGSLDATLAAFTAVNEVAKLTDSVYVNRMAEWLKNKEVHALSLWSSLDYVYSDGRPLGDHEWEEWFYEGKNSEEVRVTIGADAEKNLSEHPEHRVLYEYAAAQSMRYPWFGDTSYSAPDPYRTLIGSTGVSREAYSLEEGPIPLEHAIETAALFGVVLSDISEGARNRLFSVGLNLNQKNYDRLNAVTTAMPIELRVSFAEAFLATEYGDELGETLLEIAELSQGKEHFDARAVFQDIQQVREATRRMTEADAWCLEQNPRFNVILEGRQRAIEKRVSEILSPLPDLLRGSRQTVEVFRGADRDSIEIVETVEDITQALHALSVGMEAIASGESGFFSDNTAQEPGIKRFESLDSAMATTVRPHASERAEARYATTAQLTPEQQTKIFGEPISFTSKGVPRNTPFTLRIDLEKATGQLSVDIGGMYVERQVVNARIARAISLGAQHLAARRGEQVENTDYHVRDTFESVEDMPELFAEWVETMTHRLEVVRNRRAMGRISLV